MTGFPPDDNTCTYCKQDKGEDAIFAVTECEHYVSSDQCETCPTDQVCFTCHQADPSIVDRILKLGDRSIPGPATNLTSIEVRFVPVGPFRHRPTTRQICDNTLAQFRKGNA